MVTGPELNRLYLEQVKQMGIEITERQVTNIAATRRDFMVLGGSDIYDAKTVLLCTGAALDVDGVFIIRPAVAPANLLKGLELNGADIAVDRSMATNKPGCFAAGDCTGRPYQLTKAVGEGNVATHSIFAYLAEQDK